MNEKSRPFTVIVQEGRHGLYFVTDRGRRVGVSCAGFEERYPAGTELMLKSEGGHRYKVLQETRPAYPITTTTTA